MRRTARQPRRARHRRPRRRRDACGNSHRRRRRTKVGSRLPRSKPSRRRRAGWRGWRAYFGRRESSSFLVSFSVHLSLLIVLAMQVEAARVLPDASLFDRPHRQVRAAGRERIGSRRGPPAGIAGRRGRGDAGRLRAEGGRAERETARHGRRDSRVVGQPAGAEGRLDAPQQCCDGRVDRRPGTRSPGGIGLGRRRNAAERAGRRTRAALVDGPSAARRQPRRRLGLRSESAHLPGAMPQLGHGSQHHGGDGLGPAAVPRRRLHAPAKANTRTRSNAGCITCSNAGWSRRTASTCRTARCTPRGWPRSRCARPTP